MARSNKAGITGISAMLSRIEKRVREKIEENHPEFTTAETNEELIHAMRRLGDIIYLLWENE